jgi:hypothetical protein
MNIKPKKDWTPEELLAEMKAHVEMDRIEAEVDASASRPNLATASTSQS